MDIRSIGNTIPSGQLISDRQSGADVGAVNGRQLAAQVQTVDAVKQAAAASSAPDLEKVTKAVNDINKSVQTLSQNLEFSVEENSHRVVVKIVDQQTRQVLRQIPTEEVLEISRSLDKLQGLLIHQQA